MARKREALKHLDYNSKEYWNRLLAEDGLSVDQGLNPKLVYVPTVKELVIIEKYKGKPNKLGSGPDV